MCQSKASVPECGYLWRSVSECDDCRGVWRTVALVAECGE